MHEVGQNDDDVHEMHEGGNVDAEGGGGQDFDWLEEEFEGLDFDDDVFGNVDDEPSTHRVSVSMQQPHIGLLREMMGHLHMRIYMCMRPHIGLL